MSFVTDFKMPAAAEDKAIPVQKVAVPAQKQEDDDQQQHHQTLNLSPLTGQPLGAEVFGYDFTRAKSIDDVKDLRQAFLEYQVSAIWGGQALYI